MTCSESSNVLPHRPPTACRKEPQVEAEAGAEVGAGWMTGHSQVALRRVEKEGITYSPYIPLEAIDDRSQTF